MVVSSYGVQNRQLRSSERWMCFAALFFFLGFTATFNQFKAAPAIQFIGADLGMSVDMLSQIMGVFSIAGMVLAYPGMLVMQRFGVKFSIVVTSAIQLVGSLICVFSQSTPVFLLGRILEGVAYGLICVIGPNIMPRLFPLKDQGLCMGIWSQWTPVGVVIAFFAAPVIYAAAGGSAVSFAWRPIFPLKDQGLCMGIWSQWTPVGVVIAFFAAPVIYAAAGGSAVSFAWRPIWLVSIAMEVISIVWLLLSCKMPAIPENELVDSDPSRKKAPGRNFTMAGIIVCAFFFISIVWLLLSCKMPAIPENELVDSDPSRKKAPGRNFTMAGIIVCAFFFVWVFDYVANINTLYPTFLQNVKGLTVFDSSMLPNWTAIISIPLGIAFGVVADKLNFRKWMIAAGYLLVAVCMAFFYFTPGTDMTGPWIASVLMGLCGALVPTGTRAITPVLVPEPKKTDFVLATMAFATGLAQVVGGYIVSPLVSAIGWQANAQFVLAPLALCAALAVILFVKSDKKVIDVRREESQRQSQ